MGKPDIHYPIFILTERVLWMCFSTSGRHVPSKSDLYKQSVSPKE